ncbi:MAG TPA: copper resistance protein B [Hellea balneolensis]|uniref:Copper resistance protein B n=1 Tax=Hellea balneolensis TaxID=287478 RepID=A0A7C5LSL4_9PROT|nr:copper resistance protein B [Hellea balneolensis]
MGKHIFIATVLGATFVLPASADEKPWSMADAYYGEKAMQEAREALQKNAGETPIAFVMGDRLEMQFTDGDSAFVWDAQGWYGTDENKLWIKTEGEYNFNADEIEDAEIQALWSKPVSAFWDLQIGARYDLKPKGRTHLVAGVQGLAPYWFEIDGAVFLSTQGDVTARIEAEYELLLSQRLILQPRAEINIAAQDIVDLDMGAGLTDFDLGVRLRYEFKRELAPYIGVEWQKRLGETANRVRLRGEDADKIALLIGVRAWY